MPLLLTVGALFSHTKLFKLNNVVKVKLFKLNNVVKVTMKPTSANLKYYQANVGNSQILSN